MDNLTKDVADTRQLVNRLETEMKKFPQLELRVEHHFSLGVYARTLYIPKGVVLTGHIHKYENLNVLIQGELSILIGHEFKRVQAPFTVVSPPGTKRIATAIEDSIWMTIHGTHEQNIDLIESHFIAHSEEEYKLFEQRQLQLDLK